MKQDASQVAGDSQVALTPLDGDNIWRGATGGFWTSGLDVTKAYCLESSNDFQGALDIIGGILMEQTLLI